MYDDSGFWSKAAHDKVFQTAFGRLITPSALNLVKHASFLQDVPAVGNSRYSYMHFVRNPGQSSGEARQQYSRFVRSQVEVARKLAAQSDYPRSLIAFAQAAHAIQDSFSPVHNKDGSPVIYRGLIDIAMQGHSPNDLVGKERVADMSPEAFKRMVKSTSKLWESIYGRDEDSEIPENCGVQTKCYSGSGFTVWQ